MVVLTDVADKLDDRQDNLRKRTKIIIKIVFRGYIMCHSGFEELQLILECKFEGKRVIGRKKTSCLRNVRGWTHKDGNTFIHHAP